MCGPRTCREISSTVTTLLRLADTRVRQKADLRNFRRIGAGWFLASRRAERAVLIRSFDRPECCSARVLLGVLPSAVGRQASRQTGCCTARLQSATCGLASPFGFAAAHGKARATRDTGTERSLMTPASMTRAATSYDLSSRTSSMLPNASSSTILPSAIRRMASPRNVTCFPVGSTPIDSP